MRKIVQQENFEKSDNYIWKSQEILEEFFEENVTTIVGKFYIKFTNFFE